MLTQERLRELLTYDKDTGIFRWRVNRRRVCAGDIAGYQNPRGYIYVVIDREWHRAHRLAWLYVYGKMPVDQIDHINMVKSDNRINNLRQATNGQNHANACVRSDSRSGFKGVQRRGARWLAYISKDGKQIRLGSFGTVEEASEAYNVAAEKYFGDFARSS